MADRMPNYFVEQQRLRSEILDQESMIQKQYLAIMEMADRKQKLLDNVASTKKSIVDKQKRLDGLEKQHGKMNEGELDQLIS